MFNSLKSASLHGWQFSVTASFAGIYDEKMFDLLNLEGEEIEIRQANATSDTEITVTNLEKREVTDSDSFSKLMLTAISNRATAATTVNERSSATSSIAQVEFVGKHPAHPEVQRSGCINLVDLAGCETKDRSLSVLRKVIEALVLKEEHVPYKNSKLTHFLMPSLIGNGKMMLFVNISPLSAHLKESIKSLKYAAKLHADKVHAERRKHIVVPSIA